MTADAGPGALFGSSVAISGDTILVGAPGNDNENGADAGTAYVFEASAGGWSQEARLVASDGAGSDRFGQAVALSGNTACIGSPYDDQDGGLNAGSAYVFSRTNGLWSEEQRVTATDAAAGDFFGFSVGVSGSTALIGAYSDDHPGGSGAGSAYVFVDDGSAWSEEQRLSASDADDSDWFGYAVTVSGDTALVGTFQDSTTGSNLSGSAYVFSRSGTSWSEQAKLVASDAGAFDRFGTAVGLDGNTALVGAWAHDYSSFTDAGTAYVYQAAGLASYCTAGTSASGCQAALSASGIASAGAASGFDLMASGVEGAKDGQFFFGTQGQQAQPWGNGTSFQCVVPPVRRAGLLAGTGTQGACDGSFAQDLNALWCPSCPKPGLNPGAGAIVQAQLWYRDPLSTSNQTTSLSDAGEFPVLP